MSQMIQPQVDYAGAARRHLHDAEALFSGNCRANAGQLFGFAAECGLKAMLMACQVPAGPDGGLPESDPINARKRHPLRQHMPKLMNCIVQFGRLIPDGISAARYMAMVPSLSHFDDWSVDHRYWRETSLPLASLENWRIAAAEMGRMLDRAKEDGVLS